MKYIVIAIIGIISSILINIYAPADTENIPILSKKDRKRKKILAYISLIILILISIFIQDKVVSQMLIYGIVFQTLTITRIAYKITNNKYGYEEYLKTESIKT